MAGINDVLRALNGVSNPMLVMRQLKIPPCRMRKILESPRMRQHLALQRKMGRIMADLHATQNVRLAMSHLADMATLCPNDQIALKACTAIIHQGLTAEELKEPALPPGMSERLGAAIAFGGARRQAMIGPGDADGEPVELKALLAVLAAVIKTGPRAKRGTGASPVITVWRIGKKEATAHGRDARDTHGQDAHATKQIATKRDTTSREPDTADSRRVVRLIRKLLENKG